ncbi:MAG TPA: outer membrane lipoprotein carrier protein LolA [Stellaceae bacterium]|nr:outer membrane lipoprotein carrier protein LolA [Stellaceae bacterium]
MRGLRGAVLFLAALLFGAAAPAFAAAPVPAPLTREDSADLQRIADYLNNITTMTARFEQLSENGGVASGNLWIDRPGRMRFEYDPPSPILLIADNFYVYYVDKKLAEMSQIGLKATPAWFLLRPEIAFDENLLVTRFERGAEVLRVTVVERAKPEEGRLTMRFGDRPLQLRGWTIVDQQGKRTSVYISNARYGMPLDQSLFRYKSPFPDNNRNQ